MNSSCLNQMQMPRLTSTRSQEDDGEEDERTGTRRRSRGRRRMRRSRRIVVTSITSGLNMTPPT